MKRVLVCGGRDATDYRLIYDALTRYHLEQGISCIIQGGATGVDRFARVWAEDRRITMQEYPVTKADWQRHGKRAGPMRNRWMLKDGKPDLVIAFPGGKGTANMVMEAREAGVPVREIRGGA